MYGGTINFSKGEISSNSASGHGGGIHVTGGTLAMTGGTIKSNSASHGGGVSISGGTFSLNGGTIGTASGSVYTSSSTAKLISNDFDMIASDSVSKSERICNL